LDLASISKDERIVIRRTSFDSVVCEQLAQYTRKTAKTLKGQPALAEFGYDHDEHRLR
jgi:hypothetical protein